MIDYGLTTLKLPFSKDVKFAQMQNNQIIETLEFESPE